MKLQDIMYLDKNPDKWEYLTTNNSTVIWSTFEFLIKARGNPTARVCELTFYGLIISSMGIDR